MPFSFNPGQEQQAQQPQTGSALNNGVPTLVVPDAPKVFVAPVVEAVSPFAYRSKSKSMFGVYFQSAVFIIFGLVSVFSLALFSYQMTLKAQISSKQEELTNAQLKFPKIPIEDMKRLASRLDLVNKVVNERASVSTALTIIEESANKDVVYDKLSLSKTKNGLGYEVAFGGQTGSYASLYQQIGVLNSKLFLGPVFKKLTISGIGPLDKKGIASFKVSGTIAIEGIEPDGFTVIHGSSTPSIVGTSTTQIVKDVVATTTQVSAAPDSSLKVTP